jgi:hypothetical protein
MVSHMTSLPDRIALKISPPLCPAHSSFSITLYSRSLESNHHATKMSIELPAAADFHVHLRDGKMMEAVVPTVRQGGVNLAYVMVFPTPPGA